MNCIVKTASKLAMCFCLIFFLSTSSNAQEILLSSGEKIDSVEYKRLAAEGNRIFSLADSLRAYREQIAANVNYKNAIRIFERLDNWKRAVEIRDIHAFNLIELDDPEGMLQVDTIRSILRSHNDTISRSWAMAFFNEGSNFVNRAEYGKSINRFLKGVDIIKSVESDTAEYLQYFYLRLAFSYGQLADLSKQTEYHEEAYKIMQYYEPSYAWAYALDGLTSTYRKLGRFSEALKFSLKSKELLIDLHGDEFPDLISTYYWLSNIYRDMGETEKAKEVDLELMRLSDIIIKKDKGFAGAAVVYGFIVSNRLGDFEKSNSIIENNQENMGRRFQSYSFETGAANFIGLGEHAKAHAFIDEAIQSWGEVFPSGINQDLATFYKTKSDIDIDLKKYALALNSVQHALIANTVEFDDLDLSNNPRLNGDCISNIACINQITSKAKLSWKQYQKEGDPEYLDLAEQSIRIATDNFNYLMQSLPNVQSKLDLYKVYSELFILSTEINYEQYEQTKDLKFLSNIFNCIESTKSIGLREAVLKLNAAEKLAIPEEYARQLDSIEIKLSRLDSEKKSLVSQSKMDLIGDTQTKIQELISEQKDIYTKMNSSGNVSSSFFGNESLVSFEAFKASMGEKGFLSLLQGEEHLYVLYIDKDNAMPLKLAYGDHEDEMLVELYKAVSDPSIENWRAKSQLVYTTFLSKIQDAGIAFKEELIISPDGRFSKIPFETLMYEGEDDANLWLHRHNLSYAYSANVHVNQKRKQSAGKFIAGFSAEYDSPSIASLDTITNAPLASLVRSGEFALPGANKEVQGIVDMFGGDAFTHTTPKIFKEEAGKYKILHLATHGLISDNNPLQSSFLFEPNPTDAVNKLTAEDLYEMELNASLAVLSACESGVGKLTKGEGVMSLARAFAYTGVPSSIMTLWKVADAPSANLMLGFYENIKEEKKINSSLKQAKEEFMVNAGIPSLKHPYFWAGYVAIGDTSKIDGGSIPNLYYWLLGALVGLIILRFLMRRRKEN